MLEIVFSTFFKRIEISIIYYFVVCFSSFLSFFGALAPSVLYYILISYNFSGSCRSWAFRNAGPSAKSQNGRLAKQHGHRPASVASHQGTPGYGMLSCGAPASHNPCFALCATPATP